MQYIRRNWVRLVGIQLKFSSTIYSLLSLLSLLLIIGTAGGVEWGQISLREGVVRGLVLMVLWILSTYRAQLFYWQQKDKKTAVDQALMRGDEKCRPNAPHAFRDGKSVDIEG